MQDRPAIPLRNNLQINNPALKDEVCCSLMVLDSGLIPFLERPKGRGIKPSPRIKKDAMKKNILDLFILSRTGATGQTPSEVISKLVREKIAAAI
jgi:hypothetical protein